ncbi:hypothetical protein CBR_g42100 [Chara braunii]|uniref:Myb-like domain-containing protein n=1 Tax=Chara braunii TaxID=69332 RepID=A0A388LWW3_CHABU|nr:hypothetical protein CBR_g42100 [Chara braunii]|eukprot:GBG86817.1 hypothetical protein CBR_g42100 [Chara braunii]
MDFEEPIGSQPDSSADADESVHEDLEDHANVGGKKCRGEAWGREMTFALIEAKRVEAAKIAVDPDYGKWDTAPVKWGRIADTVREICPRSAKNFKSCKDKWGDLSRDWRKIFDWNKKTASGEENYFHMSVQRRKKEDLLTRFKADHYTVMHSFLAKKESVAGNRVLDAHTRNMRGPSSASGGGDTLPWPQASEGETSSPSVGRRPREDADDGPGMLEVSKALTTNTDRIAEAVERQAKTGETQVQVLERMVNIDERRLEMEERRSVAEMSNQAKLIDVFAKLAEKL